MNAQHIDIKKGVEFKIDSIISMFTFEEKVAMCHAQS